NMELAFMRVTLIFIKQIVFVLGKTESNWQQISQKKKGRSLSLSEVLNLLDRRSRQLVPQDAFRVSDDVSHIVSKGVPIEAASKLPEEVSGNRTFHSAPCCR